MSDLLVGCRAKGKSSNNSDLIEGIIVCDGKYTRIMDFEGHVETVYAITVHPDDVKFITMLNKNYRLRKKVLENTTDRFDILDL
jgi:hypothetical protein